MTLTGGYFEGNRCDRLTPEQLLRCFGVDADSRGAAAWLRLCHNMMREPPETALEAMRHFERLRDEDGDPSSLWGAIVDALRPVMDAEVSTCIMFGLPPWSHPLMAAVVMGWRWADPDAFAYAKMFMPTTLDAIENALDN
jgi:hypothetical protein